MTDHLTRRWLWWAVGAAALTVLLVALFVRADNGTGRPPPTTAQLVTVAELERTIISVRDQVRAEEQARAEAEERRAAEIERRAERAERASRSRQQASAPRARPAQAPAVAVSGCRGGWAGMKYEARRARAHSCWDGLIRQYFGDHYGTAFGVMWCESKGDPDARNTRSSATGLFQILGGSTDPEANVRQAAAMHAKRGWQPWSACI